MLKKISSFVLLFVLVASMSMSALAHTANIPDTGENRYKAVRLTPDIYNNTDVELSNLLVKDENGEVVPYFINSSYQTENAVAESYPLTLINSYKKDDAFYFDYALAESMEHDVLGTSIEFGTAGTDFAKKIKVLGSYDNIHWEMVQEDTIYHVDGNAKFEITFDSPKKYTNYRFQINNNLEEIAFDFVTVHYSMAKSELNYFVETITPAFQVEEREKTTVISLDGLKNLKISEITIETDSEFKRQISIMNVEKQMYNLTFDDTKYLDTTISLNQMLSREDTLELFIENNDDKPITIGKVTVKYVADEIVFEGNGERYTLEFYEESDKEAPIYDIDSYKEQILQQPVDHLNIQAIQMVSEPEVPAQPDYRIAFNIAILAVAILLGALILFKLKRKDS